MADNGNFVTQIGRGLGHPEVTVFDGLGSEGRLAVGIALSAVAARLRGIGEGLAI